MSSRSLEAIAERLAEAVAERPPVRVFSLEDSLFTVPEAAKHLRISRSSLYALVREGKLKPVRICGRTIFKGTELARFMKSLRVAGERAAS